MEYLKTIFRVARWEFLRYFKIKDVIITFAIFAVSGSLGFLATKFDIDEKPSDVHIAVINESVYDFKADSTSNLKLDFFNRDKREELSEKVKLREYDAILSVDSSGKAELLVFKLPQWKKQLRRLMQKAKLEYNLAFINMSMEEYEWLDEKYEIEIKYHEDSDRQAGKIELAVAIVLVILMIIGIFIGVGALFTGITGEKTSKVTEQVVAAISPQAWIDGKILGISLMVIAYVGSMILLALILAGMAGMAGLIAFIPFDVIRFEALVQLAVLALLGYYFWFTFFAALSATINDPNTSSKGSFMVLPVMGIFFALAAFEDPDTIISKVFGYIPITAPPVFSARVIIGDIAIWEFLLVCLIMIISIWLTRKAAGKIFATGIMIQGKEANLIEIIKWLKRT